MSAQGLRNRIEYLKRTVSKEAEENVTLDSGIETQTSTISTAKKTLNTKPVKFSSDEHIRKHQLFFERTMEIGELLVPHSTKSIAPQRDEEWEIVTEWDAVPELPKKSTGWLIKTPVENYYPRFISWSPKGDRLVISVDHTSLTTWHISGRRLGGKQSKDGGERHTNRCYWTTDGELVFYHSVDSSLSSDWVLYNSTGDHRKRFKVSGRFSEILRDNALGIVPTFNPLRPNTSQILMLGDIRNPFELALLNVPELSKNQKDLGHYNNLERHVDQKIDLSALRMAQGESKITTYAWHPSGRYVAFTLRNVLTETLCRQQLHLLDWDTAEIVASTPLLEAFKPPVAYELVEAIGWSPGGQCLALDKGVQTIWDIKSGEVRETNDLERKTKWARRFQSVRQRNYMYPQGFDWCSPDGERYLRLEWSKNYSLEVISTENNEILAILPGVKDAAWSPKDPYSFATVSGDDAPWSVRIWRLKGA